MYDATLDSCGSKAKVVAGLEPANRVHSQPSGNPASGGSNATPSTLVEAVFTIVIGIPFTILFFVCAGFFAVPTAIFVTVVGAVFESREKREAELRQMQRLADQGWARLQAEAAQAQRPVPDPAPLVCQDDDEDDDDDFADLELEL